MKWQTMFKGNYLNAMEFDGKKPTVEIAAVRVEVIEGEDGTKKEKCVIEFKGWKRKFVPSKTVAICIAAMFGDEVEKWIGRRLTLYATPVKLGKETVPGIRVFGSPELTAPLRVEVKLPKKKAQLVVLAVTKKEANSTEPAQVNASPPTASAPEIEEPPADVILPGQTRPAEATDDAAERFAGL